MSFWGKIKIGARASLLSKAQVKEVYEALLEFHEVEFIPTFLETTGDKQLTVSLREVIQTDFFTKEIDSLVSEGKIDVGIHSAKDLPNPMPKDLQVIAFTKGLNPSDAVVLKKGDSFFSLPAKSRIATSSFRRETLVKTIRSDLIFVDLRGTIEKRISYLTEGKAEGIVIAEAALIRLKLDHLNRFLLPGETEPRQGQLAIVAKKENQAMKDLFSCLDVRAAL